jgi:WhiB family redox-sensing transcriptional regulator
MTIRVRSSALREPAGWSERHCADRAVNVFYPEDDEPLRVWTRRQAIAVAICAGCPIQPWCLAEALELRDLHGVRGGATHVQRQRMLRASRAAARSTDPAVVPDAA